MVFPEPVSPGDDDHLVVADRRSDVLAACGDRELGGVGDLHNPSILPYDGNPIPTDRAVGCRRRAPTRGPVDLWVGSPLTHRPATGRRRIVVAMDDKNTPRADETAPIAGQRPAPTPGPAAASPTPAPTPAPAPAPPPPATAYDVPVDEAAPAPAARGSWRERLRRGRAGGGSGAFGVGALVAGTLAGLIVGGLGGAAIGAAVGGDDHGPGDRFGHMERGLPGAPGGDRDGDGDRPGFGRCPARPCCPPAPPTTTAARRRTTGARAPDPGRRWASGRSPCGPGPPPSTAVHPFTRSRHRRGTAGSQQARAGWTTWSSPGPTARRVRVLVVDDEVNIAELLAMALRYEGWEVRMAHTGRTAVSDGRATSGPTPWCSTSCCRTSTASRCCAGCAPTQPDVPVLFLTARDAVEDRVAGLTAGGDDYVTKPFSLEEVVARLRGADAAVRAPSRPASSRCWSVGDLTLDEDSHEVHRGGEEISLTATEFELLRFLMRNPRRVLSKAQILDRVWQYDFGGQANVVELYISYLRKKIDAGREPMIHTMRGAGYVLKPAVADRHRPRAAAHPAPGGDGGGCSSRCRRVLIARPPPWR